MANFLSVLVSLGFSVESILLFGVLFFFFIRFGHKFELLNKEISHIKETLGKDIGHIKETLSNHITDTNKKIDQLNSKFDKVMDYLLKKKS